MKLFYNSQSRAIIGHWMLEEVGAEYELVPVTFDTSGKRDPALVAVNPMGKVPTLVLDHGTVITETPAICAYLADAFPDAGLAPAFETSDRGTYYRWLFFGGSCLEPAIITQNMSKASDLPRMSVGWGSYDDVVDTIESALRNSDHLVGSRFTAADLYMGSGLWWGGMAGAPRIGESEIVQRYVARLTGRPAFARIMGG